jgi:hypothetical protein
MIKRAAQSSRPVVLQGSIPFEFASNKQVLPAGEYSIQIAQSGVRFVDAGGHALELTIPTPLDRATTVQQPRLVFHQYGAQYFLRAIWTTSGKLEFRKSHAEKEAASLWNQRPAVITAALR